MPLLLYERWHGVKMEGMMVRSQWAVLALVAAVALGAGWLVLSAQQRVMGPVTITVNSRPVALHPGDKQMVSPPGSQRLVFRAGYELDGDDRRFGGFSSLKVWPDGRFVAISDRSTAMSGYLSDDQGIQQARLSPMLNDSSGFLNSDTEGLTVRGDRMWVSTEGYPKVWVYDGALDGLPSLMPMRRPYFHELLPGNGGFEAILDLVGAGLLAVAEDLQDGEGRHRAWLVASDGSDEELAFSLPADHDPTALAAAGSDALMLLRAFSPLRGVSVKIGRFPLAAIKAGAAIEPEILATLAPPLTVDNFEGLSVVPMPDGFRLYLLSDDNFNAVQRTLLLIFDLRR